MTHFESFHISHPKLHKKTHTQITPAKEETKDGQLLLPYLVSEETPGGIPRVLQLHHPSDPLHHSLTPHIRQQDFASKYQREREKHICNYKTRCDMEPVHPGELSNNSQHHAETPLMLLLVRAQPQQSTFVAALSSAPTKCHPHESQL
jgi:hypothetical protein